MATKSPKSTLASTAKRLKKAAPKAPKSSDKVKPKAILRKQRAPGKSSTKLPPSFTLDPKPVTADPVISNDDVSLRAYFISERRQKMGWPGNSSSDWSEAESHLLAELRRREKSLS